MEFAKLTGGRKFSKSPLGTQHNILGGGISRILEKGGGGGWRVSLNEGGGGSGKMGGSAGSFVLQSRAKKIHGWAETPGGRPAKKATRRRKKEGLSAKNVPGRKEASKSEKVGADPQAKRT